MPTPFVLRRRSVLVPMLVAAIATLLLGTALAKVADAHGNIVDPMSRNYSCWYRWGSDFQNPNMATQDPMCWQAWQADPNAMWNWNGLFREGVAGNHQAAIPDGQLCSAGLTVAGRYRAMDTVGDWKATTIANPGNFTVKLFDQAGHGADYVRVYVTRQGYNPITQPLAWSNLEQVGQIGNTPVGNWSTASGGWSVNIPASAPGRTGRHIVYTIWQASHADQSYYFCADVNFGGTGSSPTASASPSRSVSASPSRSVSTSPSRSVSTSPSRSTSPAPAGGCTASYTSTAWSGGFQGEVKVTAGSGGINAWTVNLAFPSGQAITSAWNATVTTSGSTAVAKSVSYNGKLAAGASTSFGFLGTSSGTVGTPTLSCTAA
jgi:predicted carbohydrate-binding protein with CBM5 and CBM33 domain